MTVRLTNTQNMYKLTLTKYVKLQSVCCCNGSNGNYMEFHIQLSAFSLTAG